jgi:putative MATE family efflux protein
MDFIHKRELILNGNIKKALITLAIPIMLNNLIQTLYSLADMFWVSKIGSVELAATGFVWPILYLIISVGMGVTLAGTSLISQYVGSNDKKNATLIACQIFSVTMILAIILAIIGYFATPLIVKFMGANEALYINSCKYLSIMFLDIPALFIFLIFGAIRQAEGDTVSPMILNILAAITNVILDPIFILKFNLGIGGAAFATVLSKVIFVPFVLYILFTNNNRISLSFNKMKLKKKVVLRILKVGIPTCVGQSASSLGFIILNTFIVSYGNATMAAFNIGNNINSIVMMPALGIGNALASIIGQNLGAGKIDRAKIAFKTSMYMSIIILAIGGSILFLFAGNVVKIFVPNSKDITVLTEGSYYLKIISATLPFMGIFQVLVGTFQGSGHTIYSMFMEMGRLWFLRLPMILLFKNFTDLGSPAVWYSMVLSNGLICIIGMIMYSSGKWQKNLITTNISV